MKLPVSEVVDRIWNERFFGARFMFVAGSVAAGTPDEHSDLDVTVVFEAMPYPIAETFFEGGWPIEAEALAAVDLERDIRGATERGIAVIPELVAQAAVHPFGDELSQRLQALARDVIARGPAPLSPHEHQRARYGLSYAHHKLARRRAPHELWLLVPPIISQLVTYHLRAHRMWGPTPTSYHRQLSRNDPAMYERVVNVLEAVRDGDSDQLRALIEHCLAPHGGLLLDGYRDVRTTGAAPS